MNQYDVIIIGTGTAGQTAAYELHSKGLAVAVVEKSDTPGGTCALAGCQAKKWFYEGAEITAKSNHLKGKGILTPPAVTWADLLTEKNKFTRAVPGNTISGFEKAGIEVIRGTARFLDEKALMIDGQKISGKHVVIATGAGPMPLPIDGIENAITSDQFLELPGLPDRFSFIGGGFISFEFANFVARLGDGQKRRTEILEAASRPLGPFDAEMVSLLVAASQAESIDVHTNVQISAIESDGNAFRVLTDAGAQYTADIVVNAAGRLPSIDDLALDRAGIDHSRRGINVNKSMQTTQPHIFAVGDCAATVQLARVADYEAMVAAKAILGTKAAKPLPEIDYHAIPAILFTYPQYGMVGYTEDALKEKGIPYVRSFGSNLNWPTYRRIGMSNAAYKILVGAEGNFLGAHILSDNAAGIINTIRLAMLNGIAAPDLYQQSIMSPYPSRESDILYMLKPLANDS